MAIIPNNKSDAYAAIKKQLCLREPPIASQVVTATVLRKFKEKGYGSVATKVAIQMAAKVSYVIVSFFTLFLTYSWAANRGT